MTIRKQAEQMGHAPVGKLKRVADDVFKRDGDMIVYRQYIDDEGTLYAVERGKIVYITGDDENGCFVI